MTAFLTASGVLTFRFSPLQPERVFVVFVANDLLVYVEVLVPRMQSN